MIKVKLPILILVLMMVFHQTEAQKPAKPTGSTPMFVGAAYYPNYSSAETVKQDARLMKQAGFTVARMGDLVWDLMEPTEGNYDFRWLSAAVSTLSENGVESFLATPTAAIPKWMYDKHPDIMQVTATGERKPFGRRRHACLNNPVYQDYCVKIATAMATEYKTNPHIVAWQIDNELMAEEPYCYCENCREKFAKWLQNKYQTIEKLNNAWNLSFWSQNLRSFDEVFLPRKGDNPSCYQNYQQFYSDCAIDFYNLQRDAIKKIIPSAKVTHNICSSGFLYQLDLYKMAKTCDFMAIDNYPYGWTLENEYGNRGAFTYTPHMASMALSQLRGAKPQFSFWVTEAQIGRTVGNQRKIVEPGTVRLWSLQEVAQGATGISFFAFKAFPAAHEHVMACVLDEDNVPRRRFLEAQQTATELMKLREITGQTLPDSKVAIIRDYQCDWAFEDGRFAMDFRYMREIFKYYRSVRNQSVTADIISSGDSFDKYKLLVVPAKVLVDNDFCKRLKDAAASGTTVIITCMTGLRNEDVKSFGRILNASVEELAGIEMAEQHALIGTETTRLKLNNDTTIYSCGLWHDVFKTTTASVLGSYSNRFFEGKPVLTRNQFGNGTVFYVGSVVDEKVASFLVKKALGEAGIKPAAVANDELVEITEVKGATGSYVYAINYSDKNQEIQLNKAMVDVLTSEKYTNVVTIKARDYRVLKIN